MAAVVGLMATGFGGWWATHPSAFRSAGGATTGLPALAGGDVIVGLYINPRHRVELRDIEPVVSGTAGGDVTVHLCEQGPAGTLGQAAGSQFAEFCPKELPIAGSALTKEEDGRTHVLVRIVPSRPGTVVVEGARVRHVDGLQRGVEHTGIRVEVTVR